MDDTETKPPSSPGEAPGPGLFGTELTGSRILDAFLLFAAAAIAVDLVGNAPLWVFIFAGIGLIPLAAVLGTATDDLAVQVGPLAAGVIQATLGNASELILAIVALRAGLINVVQASLTGSIISNLLLVLGAAMLFGGLKFERQNFNRTIAASNTTTLFLAAVGLIVPAVFVLTAYGDLQANHPGVESLSLWTSVILIIVYAASLYYQLRATQPAHRPPAHARGLLGAALRLTFSVVLIAALSELLVNELRLAQSVFHGTDLFWGGVVFALIGNAAEHGVAVIAARRNQMDLAMAIGVGSSLQIALLLAPAMVFVSLLLGHPMSLVFSGIEVLAVVLSTIMVGMVASDGETTWLEGAQLIAVYIILVAGFYYVPL
ncbi:MAG: calcium/proton exchanger [Terriglobales bacterium]